MMRSAVILGTGPSLLKQRERICDLREDGAVVLFGVNNTCRDFCLDAWIACDPQWHDVYSPVAGDFDRWHWDKGICKKYGYRYIEGRWGAGLSTDPAYIHYGHSSAFQALNLAYHYGHRDIYLAGFDMHYNGTRHYFSGLSEVDGEYPESLRKWSDFDKPISNGPPQTWGLFQYYQSVADQNPCNIYNMTEDSALKCFPFKSL